MTIPAFLTGKLAIQIGVIAVVVVTLMGTGAYFMHKHDVKKYNKLQLEYTTFKVGVETLGKQAQKDKELKEAQDKQRKQDADKENTKLRTDLAAANKRLRGTRAGGSYLPPASPTSKRPEVAAVGRSEFESAVQRLDDRVSRLIEKGDEARVDLDSAKRWAQPN